MVIISSIVLAFVTGVISSFGHCLGMCGGIVAIYSARQPALATTNGARPSLMTRIANLLPLHLGRILTYTFFGALIGLAGSLLEQFGGLMGAQGALSIIVGAIMILLALSLLGVLPSIETVIASATSGASPMKRMRGLLGKQNVWATLGLGVLWGFLPCGLVFAMLVIAASTQTIWGGALTMFAFGLGTIPTLLGFGLAANMLSPQLRGRLQSVAALLILLFAIQTILRGLAVANIVPSLSFGPVMLW
ncbi:MAG: sulfite exporter TauE/SafE family protein [Chloroflexi bacterium]|nr:sulfite exporter TauE/SafE family protein [Chloroflexota bacterium]